MLLKQQEFMWWHFQGGYTGVKASQAVNQLTEFCHHCGFCP